MVDKILIKVTEPIKDEQGLMEWAKRFQSPEYELDMFKMPGYKLYFAEDYMEDHSMFMVF